MRLSFLFATSVLATCFAHRIAAQTPCPPAGIETDPPHATNPTAGGIVNTFNWYSGNYQPSVYYQLGTLYGTNYRLNSAADPTPYLEVPWQQANNINMERFQGKNDIAINGWQLIRRDLGYDDGGNPQVTQNPFVIIYNRYLGVLRVFATVQRPLTNFQFAEIKLVFSTAGQVKAATLNRQSALGVALEDTEKGLGTQFSVVARYLNDSRKWFTADFPMDYDPCICQYDSRLRVEVNLIKKATVNLQSTTTGSIVTSSDPNAGTGNGNSFFKTTSGAINAAGTSFDNIDKLTAKLKNDGGNATALDTLRANIRRNSFLQKGLSSIPYLGAAIGLLDFFIGGGQDSAPQPLALQPLAIQMTTKTTGTIQDTSLYATPYFFNPGNRIASTRPTDVPYYNEAMGVLSILHRPVVDVATTITESGGTRSQLIRTTRQSFRLQDIQYVINPASKLTVQDFKVALVAEGTYETDYNPGGNFSTLEGQVIQDDGSFRRLYRTNYYDALCIRNTSLIWSTTSPGGTSTSVAKMYVKVMLNLRPINASGTQQNVLIVARYPATMNAVSAFATLPVAACGVLPQAPGSAIQAVCSGSIYKAAIALSRNHQVAANAASGQLEGDDFFAVYPNPAASNVRLRFTNSKAGRVRIFLSDALGREVLQVLETSDTPVGTFETKASVSGLSPGIYYCTFLTPLQRTVQKLVVSQ